MPIITLADVKLFGRIETSAYDDELEMLIEACQSRAEAHCGRLFDYGTYTEYHDTGPADSALFVHNYPVVSVTSITDDQNVSARTITVATNVRDEAEYLNRGQVQLWNNETLFTAGQTAVKVVYVGGYSRETLPAGLKLTLVQYTLFEFNHRARIGIAQAGGDGAYARYDEKSGLPVQVLEALAPYVNWARRVG